MGGGEEIKRTNIQQGSFLLGSSGKSLEGVNNDLFFLVIYDVGLRFFFSRKSQIKTLTCARRKKIAEHARKTLKNSWLLRLLQIRTCKYDMLLFTQDF